MRNRGLSPGLALFFACLPLFGWWMTGLFDIDEGFYGAVVAEMNRRHEWITPFFNGQPWFEKPILLYWLAKPCMMLFGPDFGPRLPSVLCTIGLFVVCGFFARRRVSIQAQSMTYFYLGSSLLVIALGRLMMTDAPLNLVLTTAFLSFYESLVGDRRWRLLAAFCLGLGVLAKGPVALILFVGVTVIALWWTPSLRSQLKGYWLAGTAILIATIATWYVPCYLANGDVFVQKFLIEQNVGRFLGGDKAHSAGIAGILMYALVTVLLMSPLGMLEIFGISKEKVKDPFWRFLLVWAVVIECFFLVSSAKLPHYLLPVVPPIAMLFASMNAKQPVIRWSPIAISSVSLLLLLGLFDPLQRIWYAKSGQAEAQALVRKHPEIEVLFQLGRRDKALNTGTTKLNETSLPSLIMYLNHDVVETDDLKKLAKAELWYPNSKERGGVWVSRSRIFFTRKSRIAGLMSNVIPIEETENFGVYKLKI